MPDAVPVAGVVIIAVIDRFMSEARASTGLVSNAVARIVVAIWEGACDLDRLGAELNRGHAGELVSAVETRHPGLVPT